MLCSNALNSLYLVSSGVILILLVFDGNGLGKFLMTVVYLIAPRIYHLSQGLSELSKF